MGQSQQQLIAEADHAALRQNTMQQDDINACFEQEAIQEERKEPFDVPVHVQQKVYIAEMKQ